jgi:hypothetical protein
MELAEGEELIVQVLQIEDESTQVRHGAVPSVPERQVEQGMPAAEAS